MGAPDLPKDIVSQGEENMKKFETIISSMTLEERDNPEIIKKQSSRAVRIAKGSGNDLSNVKELMRQFDMINKMMSGFKHDRGMRKKIERMMKSGMKF